MTDSEPDPAGSMSLLLKNWSANEHEIARRIQLEYFPRLRRLSERKLQGLPGANVEADDVVQSAIKSLCRYMRRDATPQDKNRDDVWRLLCRIAACKASRRRERQTRGLRGGRLFVTSDIAGRDDSDRVEETLQELSPDDFDLIVHDAIQRLDASLQPIALMVMEGKTQQEISESLDVSRRTVVRKFDLVKRLLAAWLDDSDGS